jgi:hypothetical protein
MKTRPDALGTAKNESGSAKHELGTVTYGTSENESGSEKHEYGTQGPRYRFMFFAPGLIFGGIEGDGSCFHVLRSRTCFRQYRVRRVLFLFWRARTRSRRFRGSRVHFSCFALPNTFSTVPWASGPDFMFCSPGLVLCRTAGIGS